MRRYLTLAASAGLAALLCGSSPVWAQTIGSAQSFAIVGGQLVKANGTGSQVNGDVGISPQAATFIQGFPGFPPNMTGATVTSPFTVRGLTPAAEAAADALYNSAVMGPAGGAAITPNLSIGGPSSNGHYTPGKYFLASGTATIPTSITLDGAGDYIFSLNSDLTTSVGSTIILNGNVDPCKVWWRVPTQATLNGINFPGTVVSNALIALGSGAVVTGRALTTANGSVTLAGGNKIGGCSIPEVPTLPEWAFLMLAGLLAAAGVVALRRRTLA
jgi:hypothetical protein